VRFGPKGTEAGAWQWAPEDFDGDGDVDLVLHFETQATGIRCGATEVRLKGSALAGLIEGRDSIRTVGRGSTAPGHRASSPEGVSEARRVADPKERLDVPS
jgi:hypothetical protein